MVSKVQKNYRIYSETGKSIHTNTHTQKRYKIHCKQMSDVNVNVYVHEQSSIEIYSVFRIITDG